MVNNMSEKPNTVLDLRFIVLPSGVVMEVLKCDLDALGWLPDKRDKYTGTRSDIQYTLIGRILCTTGATLLTRASVVKVRDIAIDEPIPFNEIKQTLTEFAETGALFGDEKSVPRIEMEDGGYRNSTNAPTLPYQLVYLEDGTPSYTAISAEQLKAFEVLSEHEIPIYAPKRFKSEWTQEFPRELKVRDFSNVNTKDGRFRWICGDLCKVTERTKHQPLVTMENFEIALEAINQLQQSDVEIWRFTMSEAD